MPSGQEGLCPLPVNPLFPAREADCSLFPEPGLPRLCCQPRARLLLLAFAASFHLGQCLEQPRGSLEQQSFMDEIISNS